MCMRQCLELHIWPASSPPQFPHPDFLSPEGAALGHMLAKTQDQWKICFTDDVFLALPRRGSVCAHLFPEIIW